MIVSILFLVGVVSVASMSLVMPDDEVTKMRDEQMRKHSLNIYI